jgi:hypothetical protein
MTRQISEDDKQLLKEKFLNKVVSPNSSPKEIHESDPAIMKHPLVQFRTNCNCLKQKMRFISQRKYEGTFDCRVFNVVVVMVVAIVVCVQ